jgi:predicted Zn finger-like uncharacterized protein
VLTQCPNCETTFRVTSEILRVADGQVRCGRCHTQFDALQRLIDEEAPQELRPRAESRETPPPDPAIEVEEPAAHEEITLEGKHIEITGTYLVLDGSAQGGQPQVRHEVIEEWVEIDDEDLQATLTPEAPEPDAIDEPDEQTDQEPAAYEEPQATSAATEPEPEAEPAPDLDLFAPKARRRSRLVWRILALPLALLLIAQVVHQYRSDLARHPRLGQTIADVYDALGMKLTPDWNLHAYEIQHWAVVPDVATGTLNLRASVTNRASFPQPYPLLKLTLEDRWGDTVRAREFEPSEYLDSGAATDRLLAPAQRASVAIAIVDPGPDAAGFRFDACLRGRNGIVCSSEVVQ